MPDDFFDEGKNQGYRGLCRDSWILHCPWASLRRPSNILLRPLCCDSLVLCIRGVRNRNVVSSAKEKFADQVVCWWFPWCFYPIGYALTKGSVMRKWLNRLWWFATVAVVAAMFFTLVRLRNPSEALDELTLIAWFAVPATLLLLFLELFFVWQSGRADVRNNPPTSGGRLSGRSPNGPPPLRANAEPWDDDEEFADDPGYAALHREVQVAADAAGWPRR